MAVDRRRSASSVSSNASSSPGRAATTRDSLGQGPSRWYRPHIMRQVWIPRLGGPEVLEVREAPDPEPGPGQVRIKVGAAGVNFADTMARIGLYPDARHRVCEVHAGRPD